MTWLTQYPIQSANAVEMSAIGPRWANTPVVEPSVMIPDRTGTRFTAITNQAATRSGRARKIIGSTAKSRYALNDEQATAAAKRTDSAVTMATARPVSRFARTSRRP